ncbi:MAG: hypothetical protein Q7N50_03375 [Armatimonadota bacterium]|nr:hypothetical protein [Armatimonadota bacterium]
MHQIFQCGRSENRLRVVTRNRGLQERERLALKAVGETLLLDRGSYPEQRVADFVCFSGNKFIGVVLRREHINGKYNPARDVVSTATYQNPWPVRATSCHAIFEKLAEAQEAWFRRKGGFLRQAAGSMCRWSTSKPVLKNCRARGHLAYPFRQ